jgi:hypothetical protein
LLLALTRGDFRSNYLHGTDSFLKILQNLSDSRNFLHLWNPNVHYRVYKSPALVPIQSQMNPADNSHIVLPVPI